jgi:hypothetical protein
VSKHHPTKVIVESQSLNQLEAAKVVEKHEVLGYHCDRVHVHAHALHVLGKRDDVDTFFPLEVPHHNVFLCQRPHRRCRAPPCSRRVAVLLKQLKVLRT